MKGIKYLQLLLLHLGLGFAIYLYEPLAIVYQLGILLFFLIYILYKRNKNHEALLAASYMAGAEVFLRMNDGMVFYETGKYAVILFLLVGLYFKGFSKKAYPFWIFMLLLAPGIFLAAAKLEYGEVFRQEVAFNLSGPVCLALSAVYCFHKRISGENFHKVLLMLLLPLISNMLYLFLDTPNVREVLFTGNSSNFVTSAGYGPNQVSTVLGMGAFLLFVRLFTVRNRWVNLVDVLLLVLMSYRAVITFSRGGVLTALICMCFFLLFLYLRQEPILRQRTLSTLLFLLVAGAGISLFASKATGGLIVNRYFSLPTAALFQDDFTTGRTKLIMMEAEGFSRQSFLGLGVGKAKDARAQETGVESASHSEMSRLLAEHGIPGILAVWILMAVPLFFWLKFRGSPYFLALFSFWFLTVNHSAMRIAMPALVYGLALLFIVDEKKNSVHR